MPREGQLNTRPVPAIGGVAAFHPLQTLGTPLQTSSMRAANITAGVAVTLWFALALAGRDLINGTVRQAVPGYPNMGQIDFGLAWPLFIVVAVLVCAWICNAFRRWPWALGLVSALALAALLPYLVVYGGGV
jgi:hypothetical protein